MLLLTARTTVEDRVAGLDHGADDYLGKPFAVAELLARVRALLRRGAAGAPATLAVADLALDPATREVTRAGRRIELTPREYALLEFLLRNVGRVLSRAVIAQHVWGVGYDTFTNVIDVYVNYVRKKVDADFEPKLIHTVRGTGYVLKAPGNVTGSRSLRARLTLWYTAALAALLAVLGAASYLLLDRGLRDNVDASLESVAGVIARSSREAAAASNLDATLEALLGPALAGRLFELLDPRGRPDPRLSPRARDRLPLSPEALRNAEVGRETFETVRLPGPAGGPVRVLT